VTIIRFGRSREAFLMRPMARHEISALDKDFGEYRFVGQDIPWTIAKFLTPGDFFGAQIFPVDQTGLIVVLLYFVLKVFGAFTRYILITDL
jgi:hypothetical protein